MGAPLSLDAVLAFGFGTTARATAIVLGALLLARLLRGAGPQVMHAMVRHDDRPPRSPDARPGRPAAPGTGAGGGWGSLDVELAQVDTIADVDRYV